MAKAKPRVYLICFHERYFPPSNGDAGKRPHRGVKHYIGATMKGKKRYKAHEKKRGSRLSVTVMKAGIGFTFGNEWKFDDEEEAWLFEKYLKKQRRSVRYCKRCFKAGKSDKKTLFDIPKAWEKKILPQMREELRLRRIGFAWDKWEDDILKFYERI